MSLSANKAVTLSTSSASPTTLFDASVDGGNCLTFEVENLAASTDYVYVQVVDMHSAGYGAPIKPGDAKPFRYGEFKSIRKIVAWAGAGGATVDTRILARA